MDRPRALGKEGSEEGLTVTQAEAAQEGTEASTSQPARLSVHVVGEVANPGLYEVDAGSRVQAAIDAAGGFTNDANQGSVNLAREIVDGEQIVVASKSASALGLQELEVQEARQRQVAALLVRALQVLLVGS